MHEAEESKYIHEATATLQQHNGKKPEGWLGPWISESHVTLDLLQVLHCIPATAVSCPLHQAALFPCTSIHVHMHLYIQSKAPLWLLRCKLTDTLCHPKHC